MKYRGEKSDKVYIRENWFVPAKREYVYWIASDFARMSDNFPKIAHSSKVLSHIGNQLVIEIEAASFGRWFPHVIVTINAELFPGKGYRCSTFNHTFNTRGEEQLLFHDTAEGTQLEYIYIVTVKRIWLRPFYRWLVHLFGLPYWKRCYLGPLTEHAQRLQKEMLANKRLNTDA